MNAKNELGEHSEQIALRTESTQRILKEHTQRAIRWKESNQTSSYCRSLKYFVLFQKCPNYCPKKIVTNVTLVGEGSKGGV